MILDLKTAVTTLMTVQEVAAFAVLPLGARRERVPPHLFLSAKILPQ